jgi:ATP-dependent RNA helicase RhlE
VEKIEKIIRMQIPRAPLPEGSEIFPTPFEEEQAMAREIDQQRRREDPTFQGAFHEKKAKGQLAADAKAKESRSQKCRQRRGTEKDGQEVQGIVISMSDVRSSEDSLIMNNKQGIPNVEVTTERPT